MSRSCASGSAPRQKRAAAAERAAAEQRKRAEEIGQQRKERELELERRLAVERAVARDAHHGAAAVEWTTRTARRGEFSGDRERGGEVQERLIRPAE